MLRALLFALVTPLAACTSSGGSGQTGPATLSTNGGADQSISAFAWKDRPDQFLLTQTGNAYIAWNITLTSKPAGTSCGTGETSLHDDAASWLATVAIVKPYQQGDDTAKLSVLATGDIPVQALSSASQVSAPLAGVQVLQTSDLGSMSSGTLTIDSYTDSAIDGHFTVTGTGATTQATATFTADRCVF